MRNWHCFTLLALASTPPALGLADNKHANEIEVEFFVWKDPVQSSAIVLCAYNAGIQPLPLHVAIGDAAPRAMTTAADVPGVLTMTLAPGQSSCNDFGILLQRVGKSLTSFGGGRYAAAIALGKPVEEDAAGRVVPLIATGLYLIAGGTTQPVVLLQPILQTAGKPGIGGPARNPKRYVIERSYATPPPRAGQSLFACFSRVADALPGAAPSSVAQAVQLGAGGPGLEFSLGLGDTRCTEAAAAGPEWSLNFTKIDFTVPRSGANDREELENGGAAAALILSDDTVPYPLLLPAVQKVREAAAR